MEINPLRELYNDYITIIKNIVIKYNSDADKYETLETRRDADSYKKAYLQEDTFYTYYNYNKEVIANTLGITDEQLIDNIYNNRELIPGGSRNNILIAQRKYIIDNYVEQNNYYRELNGLPNIEEKSTEYIYVEKHVALEYGIPDNIPIHQLDTVYISVLDISGYIDLLKSNYPTKGYLNFLGNNKIDIIEARDAKQFGLLKVPYNISEAMWNEFTLIYDQCREYFMACIYIKQFRSTIDHYDNFIAMCILTMTITQILARILKSTTEREFFDDTSVKILFSVYGVPYHENMDRSIRTQIAQSLNLLIQNKGTNQVIYDITSILGYDRIKLYKYYLMKSRKFDNSGMPIEATMIDPTTGETVPDYKAMYDVYFQKVDIDDMDTYKSLTIDANNVAYEDIVTDDPYWIDDADLYKELYETEFNFIESKYMGAAISYKMTNLLYDNMYLLRMLLDNKNSTQSLMVELPKFPIPRNLSLFDTIIVLCAMTCKYNSLAGNVLTKPSQIMHVLGFNFDIDYKLIRYDILQDPYLDDTLADFFEDRDLTSAVKINTMFEKYKELYIVISDKLSTARDIETYRAYYKLYKTIFYTTENQKIFQTGTDDANNPIYANTYLEYLKAKDSEVYNAIMAMDKSDISTNINSICIQIQTILPSVKYLGLSSGTSSSLELMLLDLVRFFKSYTTDMIGFDTLYVYDLKPENILRLIDDMVYTKTIYPNDEIKLSYSDNLEFSIARNLDDKIQLIDLLTSIETIMHLNDTIKFMDEIETLAVIFKEEVKLNIYDVAKQISKKYDLKSTMKLKDISVSDILITWNDNLILRDDYKIQFRITGDTYISFFDVVNHVMKSPILNDTTLRLKDILTKFTDITFESILTLRDVLSIRYLIRQFSEIGFIDTIGMVLDTQIIDSMLLSDTMKVFDETKYSSILLFEEDLYVQKEFNITDLYGICNVDILNRFDVRYTKKESMAFKESLEILFLD